MKIKWTVVTLLAAGLLSLAFLTSNTALARKTNAFVASIFEKNPTNPIKDRIAKMNAALEKDDEQFPELIKETEKAARESKDPAEAAILHSMTAQMYHYYYESNRWDINNRTELNNFIPDDIREWTKNIFTDKIAKELAASLEPAALLQQTAAAKWKEIMKTGKDDEALRPSLYEFLAYRALDIQPSEAIYADLIGYLRSIDHPKALLLCQIDHLDFLQADHNTKDYKEAGIASLDSLMLLNEGHDYSTEIRIAQVNLMEQMKEIEGTNRDSITARQLSICEEGYRLYPKYERIGELSNFKNDTEQPTIHIKLTNSIYPGKEVKVSVNYRNMVQIKVQIYRSRGSLERIATSGYDDLSAAMTRGALVEEKSFHLQNRNTFTFTDSTIVMDPLQPGLYECLISVPGTKIMTSNLFGVTRLAASNRNMAGGNTEIFVTDYLSGKPVAEADVNYYSISRNRLTLTGKTKTDENGLAKIPADRRTTAYYKASLQNDTASMISRSYYGYFDDGNHADNRTRLSLFTDRTLYRPGQTIFFKGIAYISGTDTAHTVADKEYTLSFRDPNGKELSSLKVRTNGYGSFNGEFILPKEVLSGRFSISTNGATCDVRVEEYKRPSFYADINPLKDDVAFGDDVTIKGYAKSFSGVPLQSGIVTWRIVSRPMWFFLYYPISRNGEQQVAEGTAALSSDGSFSFTYRPTRNDASDSFSRLHCQSYKITATITDSKGESQETTSSFSVGDVSMQIYCDMADEIDKEKVQATVEARNLNGEKVQTKGIFTIIRLSDRQMNGNDQKREDLYREDAIVAKGSFVTGEALSRKIFATLQSGRYRLRMNALDSKGRAVSDDKDFILYGKDDKRPPVFKKTWLLKDKTTCAYGENASFVFGTSYDNAYILYELFQESRLIHRELIKLDNENRHFSIPFKKEYGDGIVASFTFMKEGELINENVPITHILPNKDLTITPVTFRDHLLPDSKESWTFRITDSDSTAVSAEILAGMYDASLDRIVQPRDWFFNPKRIIGLNAPHFNKGNFSNDIQRSSSTDVVTVTVPEYDFGYLNWDDVMGSLHGSHRFHPMLRSAKNIFYSKATGLESVETSFMASAPNMIQESVVDSHADVPSSTTAEDTQQAKGGKPQLRENFNETAFFFPTLLTDERGGLSIRFTMPESNTTWKLQAVAHTKDLKSGMFKQDIITSKPMMVVPSLPRFLRLGDKVSINSQIISQSKNDLKGKARLELFDPATDKLLKGYPMNCPFTLNADSTIALSWSIDVPDHEGVVGCRIIAESEEGSDGEQYLLPILSNQLLVTESTPFFFAAPGTRQLDWKQGEGRKPFRLTLEMTANPIWFAVQALPTLAEPTDDNLISWLGSLFSNTLSSYIARSNPQIRKIVDVWKAQGGTASTLYSNLQKNDDLKQILLQETPWVMEAQNETEQKQRLSLLFDLNRGSSLRSSALQHLKDHKEEDGGFSWFKGFPSSEHMTLSVVNVFTRLTHLKAMTPDDEETQMINGSFDFLDECILKDYERLKKEKRLNKQYIVSDTQLEYLYLRSLNPGIKTKAKVNVAIRFFTDQARKWEKQSLYNKGMTALLMHQTGKENIASNILDWLQKTSTQSEELGMYWANNRYDNNYFVSPVNVHCMLMNAFEEIRPDMKQINSMKQWLLNQKRTQDWSSNTESVDAIYALLLTGSDWTSTNNSCVAIYGSRQYSTADGETATGYMKAILPEDTDHSRISVTKEGTAPTWGAVYNQYFSSIDKIEKTKGPLNVEKKLFVETNSGKERQLTQVSAERSLKVGDKIVVRLTVRTDRDMNYVILKDLHAGCTEAIDQLSGMQYRDGVMFYHSAKDLSEQYFFELLPKGTFVLEYPAYVVRDGEYAGGISTIQCLCAPEFISHTESNRLTVLKGH